MRQTIVAAVFATACLAGMAGGVRAAGPPDAIMSIGDVEPDLFGNSLPAERSYYRYEDLPPVDDRRGRRPPRAPRHLDDMPIAEAIDPTKVPDWYLADSTLRPGDIVVLAGGAMVFEGDGGRHSAADFVPLQRSRLSPAEKARVAAMTGTRLDVRPSAGLVRAKEVAEAALSR